MSAAYTNDSPVCYVTKDKSGIRELLNAAIFPGLGVSLAEATVEARGCTEAHFHHEHTILAGG